MTYAVAIPAYNASKTIKETLASVLSQTVPPSEIIVVDDGSSDDTTQIAEQFDTSIRVIRQANAGCGAATTAAINATTAKLVATVDADDIWLPQKMEHQLARLKQAKEETLLFTKMRRFVHENPDRNGGPEQEGWCRSTIFMNRASFDRVGPIIDPPGNCGDMVDWISRARHLGIKTEMMPEVLALRRIISTSMTYSLNNDQRRAYLSVAREALMRRKKRISDEQ